MEFKLNDTDPKHSNGDGYITKDGHTMFNEDIVKELNRIPSLEKDKFHYDSLIDCCNGILDSIDNGKVPQKGIIGLRILLNREK
jgi:hypothetical protein